MSSRSGVFGGACLLGALSSGLISNFSNLKGDLGVMAGALNSSAWLLCFCVSLSMISSLAKYFSGGEHFARILGGSFDNI